MSSALLTVHYFDYVSFDDRRTEERLLVFPSSLSLFYCFCYFLYDTRYTFNFNVFLSSSAFELPLMYGVQFTHVELMVFARSLPGSALKAHICF